MITTTIDCFVDQVGYNVKILIKNSRYFLFIRILLKENHFQPDLSSILKYKKANFDNKFDFIVMCTQYFPFWKTNIEQR